MAQGGMVQGGMAQQLTFSRFAELLLARTYEREQREGAMRFFDTRELMSARPQPVRVKKQRNGDIVYVPEPESADES